MHVWREAFVLISTHSSIVFKVIHDSFEIEIDGLNMFFHCRETLKKLQLVVSKIIEQKNLLEEEHRQQMESQRKVRL